MASRVHGSKYLNTIIAVLFVILDYVVIVSAEQSAFWLRNFILHSHSLHISWLNFWVTFPLIFLLFMHIVQLYSRRMPFYAEVQLLFKACCYSILTIVLVMYVAHISCAIPLIASGFFAFMYNIPAGVEYYYEKTRHIATGTALAAIINISLNYYVINHFNYISVAYTTLLTYFLYFCFHYIMAWKINGSCLFSTKTVLTCSCIVLIVAIFTMIYINSWLLRWIIMVVFFSGALFYEEKKLSLGYRLKQKVMKANKQNNVNGKIII